MSVSNQTDKIYGSGNGVTQTFSFDFKIFDATQLYVYLINTTTLVVTGPLTLNTDYTVSINSVTEGGSVSFTVAPPTGYNWFVKRIVPYTQSAVIPTEGPLPGLQISNQLDLMTMMVIQDQEAVSRAFQLALTSTFSGPVYMADPVDGTVPQYSAALGQYINVLVGGGTLLPSPVGGGFLHSNGTAYSLMVSIDGSLLTGLANLVAGAGVIPIANIPVGTTANKIVQLDGTAKIPAVDGSQLTGIFPIGAAKISGIIGAPMTRNGTTLYKEVTDGFIYGWAGDGGGASWQISIGPTSSLGTTIGPVSGPTAGGTSNYDFILVPIPKGYYYEAAYTGSSSSGLFFSPVGS